MINKKHLVLLASAGAITLAGIATAQANTLEETRSRGAVQCGVSDGLQVFPRRTIAANGRAWTLTYVVPWLPPYWAMRTPLTTFP